MPFVGGSDSPPPARNKRRWQDHTNNDDDDDDDDINARGVFSIYHASESCCPFSTRRMAAPVSKRTRISDDDDHSHSDLMPSHRRGPPQQQDREKTQTSAPAKGGGAAALAPCHICHRRPTKRSDLDSFARCEGCGAQTCFVCIRQCHGGPLDVDVLSEQEALSRSFNMQDAPDDDAPTIRDDGRPLPTATKTREQTKQEQQGWAACGHRSVVCSRCCVEKGPEGEVVCLGCLFGDEAPQDMTL
ncbi:hypothetical protein ISF_00108 [Cordyceps fumosorosea ARSEF 2679]|uniref:Uncharacterized protein n=1 Tax=Cordyceps fumosorosea (strain ARSEF 2679) TaxID=1081104 RepID=A0A168DZZ7_CORFA|nr:hypothetical protein ISF_00108 [Cordyceps fumosorosea ARSEF 2679]OAA73207.1 hypothetical protein ISF_00108 [Cordyceps fumosorosea ARSEF 2679]